MKKIKHLYELNFKELNAFDSFYIESNNTLFKAYTVSSNEFNSLIKINELKQILYIDENDKIDVRYAENIMHFLYNDDKKLRIENVVYENTFDYLKELTVQSIKKKTLENIIRETYMESKKEKAIIRKSKNLNKDSFFDFICFEYNDDLYCVFLTSYIKYNNRKISQNNICMFINEDMIIKFNVHDCDKFQQFSAIYDFCKKDKMIEDFINDSVLFQEKDLQSILIDNNLKYRFISIINCFDNCHDIYQPMASYKNISYYKNITLGKCEDMPYYIIKENDEYKPIIEEDQLDIACAFDDYFSESKWKEQVFDPRDLNTLNKNIYTIDFNNGKYLKISKRDGHRYYKNIDGLFVFDDSFETESIVDDAIKTYNKLLEN